jgi:MFS family permease
MKDSPTITGLMAVAAVPILLGMTYMQLMPVFARDVLAVGPSGMGLLMSAVGAGSMVGAFISAALSDHPRKGLLLIASGLVLGGALCVFAVSQWLPLSLAALAIIGLAQALTMALDQTLLNLVTPNEYRGRMMSMYMMTWNFEPIVFLPAGWLTDQAGAPLTTVLAGVGVVASMLLIGARLKEIRNFQDGDVPREEAALAIAYAGSADEPLRSRIER